MRAELAKQLPDLWIKNVQNQLDRSLLGGISKLLVTVAPQRILTAVQEKLWEEGSEQLKQLAKVIVADFCKHFSKAEMQDKLLGHGYNLEKTKEKFGPKAIDKLREEMERSLANCCELVAINHLASLDYHIPPDPDDATNLWHTDVQKALEQIPRQDIKVSDFDWFLEEIDKRCKQAITEKSVPDIINVYTCKRFQLLTQLVTEAERLFVSYASEQPPEFLRCLEDDIPPEEAKKKEQSSLLTEQISSLEAIG